MTVPAATRVITCTFCHERTSIRAREVAGVFGGRRKKKTKRGEKKKKKETEPVEVCVERKESERALSSTLNDDSTCQ